MTIYQGSLDLPEGLIYLFLQPYVPSYENMLYNQEQLFSKLYIEPSCRPGIIARISARRGADALSNSSYSYHSKRRLWMMICCGRSEIDILLS